MNLNTRGKLLLAGLAVILGSFLLGAGIAYAGDTPVHRGDVCQKIGEERKDRSGDVYVCQQKPDDSCPRFHAKFPGHGGQPPPPCVCPSKSPSVSASVSPKPSVSPSKSPSTSVSPSAPASPTPTKSASASPGPSKPNASPSNVAVTLPVTGDSTTGYLLGASALLIGAGVLLFVAASYRRRRA